MAELKEKTKRSSVSVVIITRIPCDPEKISDPEKQGDSEKPKVVYKEVAVLRRRGKYNPSKNWAKKSYPGGCQVAVRGKLCWGESHTDALWRKIEENLGEVFYNILYRGREPRLLVSDEASKKRMYGIYAPLNSIKRIQLEPSSGNLEFVAKEEVDNILDLTKFDRETGVTDSDVIAMFPNEIEAVRNAFNAFSFLNHR